MKIENYINLEKMLGVSGLFFASGSFGTIDGNVDYTETIENGIKKYVYMDGQIELCTEFTEYPNGVVVRRDTFTVALPCSYGMLRQRKIRE